MDIKEIKMLAGQGRYHEALSECNELLSKRFNGKAELFRVRAYVYSLMGDYEKALQDRKEIFILDEAKIRDYFQAGDDALTLRDYEQAIALLKTAIKLGSEQRESWFDSAAYFLSAFAQMELYRFEDAIKDLNKAVELDPNCSMPLPEIGMWDHHRLREEILRRASGKIAKT